MEEDDEILSQYSDYEECGETKPIYDKYEFYSLDGVFLGYASKTKIRFYSKRQECCTVDHFQKRITFNKPFDASRIKSTVHYHKENICVICGDDYNLSATKIIPKCFTHHFPPEIKTGSENIISVCKMCLNRVDKHNKAYKQKLYQEYSIDVEHYEKINLLCDCYKLAKNYLDSSMQIRRDTALRKLTRMLFPLYLKQEYVHTMKLTKEQIEEFVKDVETNKIIDPSKDYLNDELIARTGDLTKFKEDWLKTFFDNIEVPYLPKVIN